jgi:hypothetical protein
MRTLERIGIDERDRQLIRKFCLGQTFVVRVGEKRGELGRGVRQGCPLLSPLLFNIYIQALIAEALENTEDGVRVGGHLVNAVRFADDQAMVASSNAGLQRIMDTLNKTSGEYGMKINIKKTKTMKFSRTEGGKVSDIIDGKKLEQVRQFCYLGSMLTEDCRCHTDIKRRIAMAKEALTKKGELMRGTLSLDLKKRIIKTLIWSVVLYGSETWTLVKADIKRLEACEMWIWRKIMKISWTEHKTNDDVLKMVQEERTMIDTIRRRQKN